MKEIYKGADEVINVTITDGTNPIVISDCEDVIVSVYQTKSDIIQQWKISDGSLKTVNDAGGIAQANLDRNNTADLPERRLYLEVVVEIANTDFEAGIQRMIQSDIAISDLKNSVL